MGGKHAKVYAEEKKLAPTEDYPLVKDVSQLRFLDYEIFKLLKRFPEANKFTTSYSKINKEESICIFISHVWLTGKFKFLLL